MALDEATAVFMVQAVPATANADRQDVGTAQRLGGIEVRGLLRD